MLQLFARKDQPRAEHHVRQIARAHWEHQEVDLHEKGYDDWIFAIVYLGAITHLENKRNYVHHAAHSIPRIPSLDRQPRHIHVVRLIGGLVELTSHTVAKERERGPCEARCDSGQHDQQQQFAWFLQRNTMIPGIRFGKQRIRIRGIPNRKGSA